LRATVESAGFIAGLEAWAERAHKATQRGVEDAGAKVKEKIEANLALREYPPAAPVGSPPAMRSGALHDSVQQRLVELGAGFQARVYPSIVYARIHELSGRAGKGHRSFLPKRPYVGPAFASYKPDFRSDMLEAWRAAAPGG
jgi:hypothetical protein